MTKGIPFPSSLLLVGALLVGCDGSGSTEAAPDQGGAAIVFDTTTWGYAWNSSIGFGALADSRDGQVYRTVVIGHQVWMAENLNFKGQGADSGWCWSQSLDSCEKYGRLYSWMGAMVGDGSSSSSPSGVRGACPAGWHVPSLAEWDSLFGAIGGIDSAGYWLKASTGWRAPGGGVDQFGFRVTPTYQRMANGIMGGEGNSTRFWTTTLANGAADVVYFTGASLSHGDHATTTTIDTALGNPLRCVRD